MFKKVLTSPNEHNPDDFIYLVHGLMDWRGKGITSDDVKYKIDRIKTCGEFYCTSMIGHMDRESAKKRLGWHGGELYRMFTFGKVGLIINPARDEDVKIAWYCDLGSPDPKKLKEYVEQYKGRVRSPLYIFTKSIDIDDVFGSNELILEGNPETQIEGVFYRDDNQAFEQAKMIQKIVRETVQKDIPIVELPRSRVSSLSPIEQMAIMHQIRQLLGEFYRPELYK